MVSTELFVSLKVPDNVAITAFHTLERIGYKELKKLERQDYYKFDFSGNKKSFEKKISQIDILINANKHKFSFSLEKNEGGLKKINVLVKNLDNGSELLRTLRERLGIKNIKAVEKGVLWSMYLHDITGAENIAVDITKNLLMNENYQKFSIIE